MFLLILAVTCLLNICDGKLCWKECGGDSPRNVVQSIDIINCTRRSTYPEQEDFWCEGTEARLTQSIKYITPFLLELPWIGVETEVCDFLDDGKGCQDNAQARTSMLKFPINVLEYYPTGTFPIRYKLFDEEEKEIACFHFTIKIF